MLSHITFTEVAIPRPRSGMGALLTVLSGPAAPRALVMAPATAVAAVAYPRPRMSGVDLFRSTSAHAAARAKSAVKQPTSQKFAYTTTRNAAIGGGAMGPHPARDPV